MQVVPTTTTVAVRDGLFSTQEELALLGFLAGYSGLTREAYQLDLRQYVTWCTERGISLFGARRADIESFGRSLESRGRARATIARRLCTVACFYRYAEQEGLIRMSPAVHVRRPRLDYESHATGLDRNEVGGILVAAGLGHPRDHALLSLLALNGLRISEALGADIERLGLERGHRTLTVLRKGGKVVTVPLAPRTARAVDLAVGERHEGPIFVGPDGTRLDRHAAARIVRRIARRARDRQTGRAAHVATRVHHCRARRRGAATGRARSGQSRRPAHDDALRPGPRQPRPPRHVHRRDLHRRSSPLVASPPVTHDPWRKNLRIAAAEHDAAAVAQLGEHMPDDGLQHAGDAVLVALAVDPDAVAAVAAQLVEALRARFWDGDAELADAIENMLGRRSSTLAPIEIDLDLFAEALTEPPGSIGYLDLRDGVVITEAMRDWDGEDADTDFDDGSRWLAVPGEGSAEAYRDMQHFITTVNDPRLAERLAHAIEGRGAFRRFYDTIATNPAEHTRWQRHSDDARLGRARSWLADQGYQPAVH